MTRRAASAHTKTVELQPHELPPPPNAVERVVDHLERAATYAIDAGPELAGAIADLLSRVRKKRSAA